MKIYYVIKYPDRDLYLSSYGSLVLFGGHQLLRFSSEESAFEYIKNWNGNFIIEKVYSTE